LIVVKMSSEDKDFKVPKFDGTKEGWMYWKKVFLSVLVQKNMEELMDALYDEAIQIPKANDDCMMDVEVGDEAVRQVDESKLKLKKQNAKAFAMLLGNMNLHKTSGKIAFSLVDKYQDERGGDYPAGNFKSAWDALEKKYNPKTVKTKTDLQNEYYEIRLAFGREERPSEFIHKLTEIKTKLEAGADKALYAIPEAQFKIAILSKLPRAQSDGVEGPYEVVRAKVMEELTKDPNSWSIEDIADKLDERHDALFPQDGSTTNGEVGLSAHQVKAKCNKCGRWGHKSHKCPDSGKKKGKGGGNGDDKGGDKSKSKDKDSSTKDKSKLECWYCKKTGHVRADCWELKKKRESQQEQGAIANELVLTGMETPPDDEDEECFTVDDSFFDNFGSSDEEESDDFEGVEDTPVCVVNNKSPEGTKGDTAPETSGIAAAMVKEDTMKVWS
jgi:hypothetical protein